MMKTHEEVSGKYAFGPERLLSFAANRVGRTRLAIISRILVKDKTASDHFF